MAKTRLFIVRHGKTMFNTIGRAQGWSDTPLTAEGEEGIRELGVGLKASEHRFKEAFSSDSGRTLQTMEIILREIQQETIPYTRDKRIREWCFGSMDGSYDVELFYDLLPRIFDNADVRTLTYQELADGIHQVDTTGWSETWSDLSTRIMDGFTAIAKKMTEKGGGDAIIVSHGLTIVSFLWLLDPTVSREVALDNGSVSLVEYDDGRFTIKSVGDMSYREKGRLLLEKESNE